MNEAINDVVKCIICSDEYKKCMELKEKMSKNSELISLIDQVKNMQKKYVRSNYDEVIKEKLDVLENKLNDIPIYVIYKQNLEKVNEKICFVKDELNYYFYNLLNEKFI